MTLTIFQPDTTGTHTGITDNHVGPGVVVQVHNNTVGALPSGDYAAAWVANASGVVVLRGASVFNGSHDAFVMLGWDDFIHPAMAPFPFRTTPYPMSAPVALLGEGDSCTLSAQWWRQNGTVDSQIFPALTGYTYTLRQLWALIQVYQLNGGPGLSLSSVYNAVVKTKVSPGQEL